MLKIEGFSRKEAVLVRSPEQTAILQHYNDRIGARLSAEDRSYLDQIREEYQAEGRRFNEAEKDRAIERSSGQLAMLQSSIAASREATEDIVLLEGARHLVLNSVVTGSCSTWPVSFD